MLTDDDGQQVLDYTISSPIRLQLRCANKDKMYSVSVKTFVTDLYIGMKNMQTRIQITRKQNNFGETSNI